MYVLLVVVCLNNGHCEASAARIPFVTEHRCESEAPALIQGFKNFREFTPDIIVYEKHTCINFGEAV